MNAIRDVVRWASNQPVAPLPADAVPGADESERTALAALGGLAGALSEPHPDWPRQIRKWMAAAPPPTHLVDEVLREMSDGVDVLARAYEMIVSGRSRRRLGTFFTPLPVVTFMLDAAERVLPEPCVVVDPGAGVGAFSLAARRRWPRAQVLAVDLNVVTLGLLGAQSGGAIDLVLADYLSWATTPKAPESTPRLWVGNPPYTRHQDLTASVKSAAAAAAGELVSSGLAGLSAYFLAATVRAMSSADALCFVLPGSWTEARYGAPLRKALRDLSGRTIDFVGFDSDLDVFPGTRVTAMVLVVGPDVSSPRQPMRTATARLTLGGVSVSKATERSRRDGAISSLGRWLWPRKQSRHPNGLQLGDVARVRRGVATGANDFFLLGRADRDRLPPAATVRAVRRLRHVVGDELTLAAHQELELHGERCWLLRIDDSQLLSDPALAAWLDDASKAGVKERYLIKHRKPWYRVEDVEAPDLLMSPMGKRRMRVVTNDARAIPSNALYGIYLKDPGRARVIAAWLNAEEGQVALLERARTYGADLFKLEPRDLLTIRLPRGLFGEVRIDKPDLGTPVTDRPTRGQPVIDHSARLASSAGSLRDD